MVKTTCPTQYKKKNRCTQKMEAKMEKHCTN